MTPQDSDSYPAITALHKSQNKNPVLFFLQIVLVILLGTLLNTYLRLNDRLSQFEKSYAAKQQVQEALNNLSIRVFLDLNRINLITNKTTGEVMLDNVLKK